MREKNRIYYYINIKFYLLLQFPVLLTKLTHTNANELPLRQVILARRSCLKLVSGINTFCVKKLEIWAAFEGNNRSKLTKKSLLLPSCVRECWYHRYRS